MLLLLLLKMGVRLRVVLGLTHEHHVVLLRVQHGLLLLLLLGLRRHHSHLVLLGWRRHELLLRLLLLLLVHVGRWMAPLLLRWLGVLLLLLEVGLVLVLGLHAAVHYELVADNANLVLGWLWRPRVGVGFIFLNNRRIG